MPLPVQQPLADTDDDENPDSDIGQEFFDEQGKPHITVTPVQVTPDEIKALTDKYSGKAPSATPPETSAAPSVSSTDIDALANKYSNAKNIIYQAPE